MWCRIVFTPIFYLLVNYIIYMNCVDVPPNPCPDIFQYVQDKNSDYYGIITLPYTKKLTSISTGVLAWMPGYYPEIKTKHLELKILTSIEDFQKDTTRSIIFQVDFPFKNVVPIISLIGLNDNIYCNGTPVPENDGTVEFTTCSQTLDLDLAPICDDNQDYNQEGGENNGLDFPTVTERIKPNIDLNLPPNIGSKIPIVENVDLPTRIDKFPAANIDFSSNYDDICGRPKATSELVFYGKDVPRGAYPWLVAIFRKSEPLSINYICSGSLISDRHVVTAAHCAMVDYRRARPNELICIFGKLDIGNLGIASEEKMLHPESIILHPEYKTGKANADIALLTFADPIPFNQLIMPVCLWEGSNDLSLLRGSMGTVVGWGKNEDNISEPRQISMPIVSQLECLARSTPSAVHALLEVISDNTFCAGLRNGSGPCMGDSGSAFLINRDGIFYLRGIVSTALSDPSHTSCNLKEFVVFTDASKYIDWLSKMLK